MAQKQRPRDKKNESKVTDRVRWEVEQLNALVDVNALLKQISCHLDDNFEKDKVQMDTLNRVIEVWNFYSRPLSTSVPVFDI